MSSEAGHLAPESTADYWLWRTVQQIVPPCPSAEVEPATLDSLPKEPDQPAPEPAQLIEPAPPDPVQPDEPAPPDPVQPEEPAAVTLPDERGADTPTQSNFSAAVDMHRLGRWEEAARLYALIPEADDSYADALVNLIAIAAARDDSAQLRERGEQLLKLRRTSRPALEALMQAAMATGDYEAGAQHGARLVKHAPDSYDVWFNLGICYQKTSHDEQAAQAYTEAIKLRPNGIRARANLGVLLQTHGDIIGARREYEQALLIEPENPGTLWNLALVHEKEGQIARAEKIYLRLIREGLQVYTVAFRLGRLRLNRKNYLGAIEAFERCLLEQPGDQAAEMNLLMAKQLSGDTSACSPHPADTVELLALQATAAVEASDWKRAVDIQTKLSGKGENTAILIYNIGVLQQRENLLNEAIQSYDQALAEQPGFAEANLNRGYALMLAGQADQARSAWLEALNGKPAIAAGYFRGATLSEATVSLGE